MFILVKVCVACEARFIFQWCYGKSVNDLSISTPPGAPFNGAFGSRSTTCQRPVNIRGGVYKVPVSVTCQRPVNIDPSRRHHSSLFFLLFQRSLFRLCVARSALIKKKNYFFGCCFQRCVRHLRSGVLFLCSSFCFSRFFFQTKSNSLFTRSSSLSFILPFSSFFSPKFHLFLSPILGSKNRIN